MSFGIPTIVCCASLFFFFSSRRRHTRCSRDWSSDVCSSDLFASGKKCDTCKLDFPDINGGWVAPEGTMGDVVTTLEKMYGAAVTAHLPRDQRHPWFGHPVRTTVGAKATDG